MGQAKIIPNGHPEVEFRWQKINRQVFDSLLMVQTQFRMDSPFALSFHGHSDGSKKTKSTCLCLHIHISLDALLYLDSSTFYIDYTNFLELPLFTGEEKQNLPVGVYKRSFAWMAELQIDLLPLEGHGDSDKQGGERSKNIMPHWSVAMLV
jgi:hypothetical protein